MGARDDSPDGALIVDWSPQIGPQLSLLRCPVFEAFYGGARGGGKTDGMLGEWVAHAYRYGDKASGLMVRRTRTELYDTIERSKQLYAPLGAKFHEQDKVWRFPGGGRLRFAYLERDADAEGYQGHNYTRVYVEEIGNFPSPAPIMKLMATLRSGVGVPCRFRATGNPGGPGHHWVKARYIDPAPKGYVIIKEEKSSLERVYIPARVSDNTALMRNDPTYIDRLSMSGSPELVRAWLEGDWSVIAGAFFPEFSAERHVIAPFEIPAHWARFRSGDWGSARPFAIHWYAVSDGDDPRFPRGALIVYREWYGMAPGQPNVGLKLTAEEVGMGVVQREHGDVIEMGWMDPAAFSQDGGPSIAERMLYVGCMWARADNARVSRSGALGGWDQVRARLKGEAKLLFGVDGLPMFDDEGKPMLSYGKPMLFVFSTCVHLIRTLPALQHDELKAEDVDTDSEDHAPDSLRYGCMSRPYVIDLPSKPAPRWPTQLTINELIERQRRRREQEA